MGRPPKHDAKTEKWLADLTREHGPRPAAELAKQKGVDASKDLCQRLFKREYPGQSADPTARIDQDAPAPPAPRKKKTPPRPGKRAASPAAPAPPPKPPPDEELLAAHGQGQEELLEVALKRAVEMSTHGTVRERQATFALIERLSDRLERVRQAKRQRQERPYRIVELRLPPKEPPP